MIILIGAKIIIIMTLPPSNIRHLNRNSIFPMFLYNGKLVVFKSKYVLSFRLFA